MKTKKGKKKNPIERLRDLRSKRGWLTNSRRIAGLVLEYLREENVSKKALAEKLEVTPQYVNKLLKGQQNLTLETIDKIEKALDKKIIEVLGYERIDQFNETSQVKGNVVTTAVGASYFYGASHDQGHRSKDQEQHLNQYQSIPKRKESNYVSALA